MKELAAGASRSNSEPRSPPEHALDDDAFDEPLQVVFAESAVAIQSPSSIPLPTASEVPREPDYQI